MNVSAVSSIDQAIEEVSGISVSLSDLQSLIDIENEVVELSLSVGQDISWEDMSLFEQAICYSTRFVRIRKFDSVKNNVQKYLDDFGQKASKARFALSVYGMNLPVPSSSLKSIAYIKADRNVAPENEDWSEAMGDAISLLRAWIDEVSRLRDEYTEGLDSLRKKLSLAPG